MKVYIQLVISRIDKSRAFAIVDQYGQMLDVYKTREDCEKKIECLKGVFKSLEEVPCPR